MVLDATVIRVSKHALSHFEKRRIPKFLILSFELCQGCDVRYIYLYENRENKAIKSNLLLLDGSESLGYMGTDVGQHHVGGKFHPPALLDENPL